MAKQIKKKSRSTKFKSVSPFKNYWKKENYILLGIGLFVLIAGFSFMTFGPWDHPFSLTVSPIVLLVAYLIIFPLSILYKKKKNSEIDSDVPRKD